jgi:hypothetical protein
MATIAQLRTGLAARLATISGLRTSAYIPPNPQTPSAHVVPTRIAYDETFDGDYRLYADVWLYLSPTQGADLEGAQEEMDAYMLPVGSKSLAAAINADPTLGGVAEHTVVRGWAGYLSRLQDEAGRQLVGSSMQVEVAAES